MSAKKVVLLKGDGIGPEIVGAACTALEAVCKKHDIEIELEDALIGGAAVDAAGDPLPQKTVDSCLAADAVLLGAVGGYKWDSLPSHLRPEKGLLGIRKALGLFANLRPAKIVAPLKAAAPIKDEIIGDSLDVLIVRELTGGIYFGEKGRKTVNGAEAAFDTECYSVPEIERIARMAFEFAMKRSKRLCSVDKENVLESSKLWRSVVKKVAEEYPQVELTHMYVDNAAMQLVRNPKQFDVIVTSNMFGDILSDEASQIAGSIGMLASASLNGDARGLYEPIHGSAPDIAGKDIANPLATILSVAMMLRFSLDEPAAADDIEAAVAGVLDVARTPDIAADGIKTVGCAEMGRMVAQIISEQ